MEFSSGLSANNNNNGKKDKRLKEEIKQHI